MGKNTPEQMKLLRQLAEIVINVAERHPGLRGPRLYDDVEEARLQEHANAARRFLGIPVKP